VLKRLIKKATTIMAKNINNAGVLAIAAMAASAPKAEVIKAPTKADLAREVFHAAYAEPVVPARKDILDLVQAVANLSKAAASTYLQNFKRKEGLSRPVASA
jgi:hypothetical protein